MSEPRVSVVIPAYRATRTIAATIASVRRQTMADFELLVVDDGSGDETPRLVAELIADEPRARLIERPNGGTAAARNTGIAAARAPLVAFLDNDDLWMPEYLERMCAALDGDPVAALAYTDAWVLDDGRGRVRTRTVLDYYPPVPAHQSAAAALPALLRTNFIMSSTTVRAAVLAAVGGFDPELSGVDDYDLWLRIVAGGGGLVRAAGTLLIQRDRVDSQSKDELKMIDGHRRVLERLAGRDDLDPADRRVLEAELRRFAGWTAALEGRRPLGAATLRARGVLGALRERLVSGDNWPAEPPAAVAAAFPDLLAGDPQAKRPR